MVLVFLHAHLVGRWMWCQRCGRAQEGGRRRDRLLCVGLVLTETPSPQWSWGEGEEAQGTYLVQWAISGALHSSIHNLSTYLISLSMVIGSSVGRCSSLSTNWMGTLNIVWSMGCAIHGLALPHITSVIISWVQGSMCWAMWNTQYDSHRSVEGEIEKTWQTLGTVVTHPCSLR